MLPLPLDLLQKPNPKEDHSCSLTASLLKNLRHGFLVTQQLWQLLFQGCQKTSVQKPLTEIQTPLEVAHGNHWKESCDVRDIVAADFLKLKWLVKWHGTWTRPEIPPSVSDALPKGWQLSDLSRRIGLKAALDARFGFHYQNTPYEQIRDPSFSGGDSATAEYRHPFALHRQRNLRARADFQRHGRVRETALHPVCRHARLSIGDRAWHHRDHGRQGRHHHDHRHRLRHDAWRTRGKSRHHRALRHEGISQTTRRGEKTGCWFDRPVRRGILFRVHGREESHRPQPLLRAR